MTYTAKQPDTSYIINSAAGCIVNVIFGISGTLLTFFVVFTFWKSPKLRKKISYFIIMVLSFGDIGVEAIVHQLHVMNSVGKILRRPSCRWETLYQTSAVVFSGMSTITFFVMNIERYLSIVHPIFHLNHMAKKKCLAILILLWFICIIIAIVPIFGIDIKMAVVSLAFVTCFGTLFAYISIYIVAKRRIKAMTQTKHVCMTDSRNTNSFFRELQLAKIYLLVVFSSFITQIPNALVLTVWSKKSPHLITLCT